MRAGLKVQSRTATIASNLLKIGKQRAAGTGGTLQFVRYQIIYVETSPDVSILELAEDRDADDSISAHCQAHFPAIAKDVPHLFRIVSRQLRTQLPVHAFRRG